MLKNIKSSYFIKLIYIYVDEKHKLKMEWELLENMIMYLEN